MEKDLHVANKLHFDRFCDCVSSFILWPHLRKDLLVISKAWKLAIWGLPFNLRRNSSGMSDYSKLEGAHTYFKLLEGRMGVFQPLHSQNGSQCLDYRKIKNISSFSLEKE